MSEEEMIVLATLGSIEDEHGQAYFVKIKGTKMKELTTLVEAGVKPANVGRIRSIIKDEIKIQKRSPIHYDYNFDLT